MGKAVNKMPDQPTLDAFLTHARRQPCPLPLVGRVGHDSNLPGAVYIGRRYAGIPESKYHNPYRMPQDGDRAAVIAAFERYARACLAADPEWLRPLAEAWEHGPLVLVCWCRRVDQDRPACHGDTIRLLLAEQEEIAHAR